MPRPTAGASPFRAALVRIPRCVAERLLCSRAMASRHTHPSAFMFLIVPFGALGGYLSVAVAYLLKRGGISVEEIATLVALSLLPQTWKFLWAPITDTTLTRKG